MCQPLRISLYIPWRWGIPLEQTLSTALQLGGAWPLNPLCDPPGPIRREIRNPGYCRRLVTSFFSVTMTVESKMASPDLLSYGFSVIVALGGVIGYAKAGWCLLTCFQFFKACNDWMMKFQLAAASVHMCDRYYATVGHRLKTLGFMRCFTQVEIFSVCIRLFYIE